jgi:formimidoylglutamate deiminase
VGICPTTEANLGDGVLPAEELLAKGAVAAIGTDSNVSVDPLGELRLLEYAQRLIQRRRGVLTALPDGLNLWQRCAEGGARALGQPVGVLQTGKRADFLVLDKDHQALVGRSSSQLLDSLIFAADPTAIRDVYVGGSKMVSEGHVNNREQRLRAFAQVIAALS